MKTQQASPADSARGQKGAICAWVGVCEGYHVTNRLRLLERTVSLIRMRNSAEKLSKESHRDDQVEA